MDIEISMEKSSMEWTSTSEMNVEGVKLSNERTTDIPRIGHQNGTDNRAEDLPQEMCKVHMDHRTKARKRAAWSTRTFQESNESKQK